MPGSTSCSPADGLSRPPAGRMCGANSSMFTPPPPRRSPRKRSIASASFTRLRRRSMVHRPTGDDKNDSGARNRLPKPCRPGPKALCASSRANPNSPKPFATCGRAGLHWCAASTMAAWHSTNFDLIAGTRIKERRSTSPRTAAPRGRRSGHNPRRAPVSYAARAPSRCPAA